MLKNPSPGPNWSDGLRIVQSRPDARDERLGLGLGARVVEVRVVLDAHRAHVDEAPDARPPASPRRRSRVPSVLTRRRSRPAAEVARDGDEVERPRRRRRGPAAASRAGSRRRSAVSTRSRAAPAPGGRCTASPAVGVRTRATTRCPASRSAGTVWLPTNPLAPVTRMVDMVDPCCSGRRSATVTVRSTRTRRADAPGRRRGENRSIGP